MISVIVPVYNTVEYLGQCVESILNQTYQDIEIFLIDDGSTDGAGALCDYYAEMYARVTVIHQKTVVSVRQETTHLNEFMEIGSVSLIRMTGLRTPCMRK